MATRSQWGRPSAATRGRAGVFAAFAAALLLAGCQGDPATPSPPPQPTSDFARLAQSHLDQAEDLEFDEAQVAILERAVATESISFEDYQGAVHAALECIAEAGFYTEIKPVDDSRGFSIIDYFYESPEDGSPVAEACLRTHSEAVESLYQLQPSSVGAQDRNFLAGLDAVVACLEGAGVTWETEGKTVDELWNELLGIWQSEPLPVDGGELGPIRSCDAPPGS